ncbi:MAG: peptidylprolyl isomerase [Spirochaetia bacterium]|nr:peptidylprolyl isomerase [Spirochaetia bacterium]
MKKLKLSFAAVLLLVFVTTNCNKTLATYEGGTVTSKEINALAGLYNIKSRLDNPDFKRRIVQDYGVIEILSGLAGKQNLEKEGEAIYLKKLFEGNIIRNILYQQKQEELNKEKEPVFHARHILIKIPVDSHKNTKGAKAEATSDGQKEYETIAGIRGDILNKKITFEDAAQKYSEDDASKVKKGDLGFFTKGIMLGEFQDALNRMAGDVQGTPMRIAVDKVKLLSKPDGAPVENVNLEQDAVVMVIDNNPPGWSKISKDNYTVYIPSNQLKPIDDEKKISAPVKTLYGWHIIELLDKKNVTVEDYGKLIKKSELKDQKDADNIALSRAKMYWSRIKGAKLSEWQQQLYRDYGLDPVKFPELTPDWKTKASLIDNEKLKISANDFKNFIEWVSKDQGLQPESVYSDKDQLQRYFRIFTELQLYSLEGQREKVFESKSYKNRADFERKQFLAELYKKKMWYGQVSWTEKELMDEYNKMKKGMPPHVKKMGTFAEMKDDIIRQVRGQKINAITQQKTQELLQSVKFTVNDKALK